MFLNFLVQMLQAFLDFLHRVFLDALPQLLFTERQLISHLFRLHSGIDALLDSFEEDLARRK